MPSTNVHCSLNAKLSSNVSGTSLYSYFNQQRGGFPKLNEYKSFRLFFVDYIIIDAKLFFVAPTLWHLIGSERCTLIVRHGILK